MFSPSFDTYITYAHSRYKISGFWEGLSLLYWSGGSKFCTPALKSRVALSNRVWLRPLQLDNISLVFSNL